MTTEDLDGEATESFGFKLSTALRLRLGQEAALHKRTVGREVVLRLIKSFELSPDEHSQAARLAALEKLVADLETRVKSLEAV